MHPEVGQSTFNDPRGAPPVHDRRESFHSQGEYGCDRRACPLEREESDLAGQFLTEEQYGAIELDDLSGEATMLRRLSDPGS